MKYIDIEVLETPTGLLFIDKVITSKLKRTASGVDENHNWVSLPKDRYYKLQADTERKCEQVFNSLMKEI
jgi:hypothetical protein